MSFRTIGHIVRGIGGRPVVLAGIDTESRKVSRVARPNPVVRVAAEFADGRWRSADQPHVVELLIDEQKLLVAVVHLLDRGFVAFALGFGNPYQCFRCFARCDAVVTSSIRTKMQTYSFLLGNSSARERAQKPWVR